MGDGVALHILTNGVGHRKSFDMKKDGRPKAVIEGARIVEMLDGRSKLVDRCVLFWADSGRRQPS
jgi:hypothetical protein